MLVFKYWKKSSQELKFLHVCDNAYADDDESWEGRILHLDEKIKKINKENRKRDVEEDQRLRET